MWPDVCAECGFRSIRDELSVLCRKCCAPLGVPDSSPMSKEDVVLPPLLDRAEAAEALREWMGSRRFAPGTLKELDGPDHCRLAYVPHWTFDARAVSTYKGERGEYYHVTETTRNSNGTTSTSRVRKTRWRRVDGSVENAFKELLIVATEAGTRDRIAKLAPWPLEAARSAPAPSEQILSRMVAPDDAFAQAKGLMNPTIQRSCRDDIGGDDRRVHKVETTYVDVARRSLLLPVWTAGYRHGGKAWHVLVNAATGEVHGQRPYSGWKILAAVGVGVLVVAGVVVAVATR